MGEDFRVRLAAEDVAAAAQLGLQLQVVLEDAVVHHRHALVAVGVRILIRGAPVGGPAGMANAQRPHGALAGELGLKVFQLPAGAHHVQRASLDDGDAGGVIAPVLELLQPVDEDGGRLPLPDVTDDAAHSPWTSFSHGSSPCSNAGSRRPR